MILIEKEINIIQVQCLHSCFANKLTKFLSINKCTSEMVKNNIIIKTIIDILKRFQPFESQVYNAQEIVFTKGCETGDITIDLVIDAQTLTYTGENNITSINNYFVQAINDLGLNYIAILADDTFYIYSYNNTENFTIIPTITITPITITSQTLLSFSINSLENNLEKIVNLWNCISEEEFYNLKNKIINLTTC